MAANAAQVPTQETSTAANVDVISLQVSLPQMLDLALGTPEIGAVNFNILHNFLHVLLHQTNLQNTKVEYRGENAQRIKTMVASLKSGPALYLHEYSVTDGTGEVSQRIREDNGIDILTEDDQLPAEDDLRITKVVKQQVVPEKDREFKTVLVEPIVNGSTPTALKFRQLQQAVEQLQQQFQALEELSTTPEVVERLKGRITDPVADVWQFININKRLDASEQGIDKLTTMIQDMMKGDISVAAQDISLVNTKLNELEVKVSGLEQKLADLQTIIDVLIENISPPTEDYVDAVTEEEVVATDESVVTPTIPIHEKEETTKKIPKIAIDKSAVRRALADDINIAEMRRDIVTLKAEIARIQRELQDLNEKIAQIGFPMEATEIGTLPVGERPVPAAVTEDKRIVEIKDAVNLEQLEAMKKVEAIYGKALHDITKRMNLLEKEFGYLLERVDRVQAIVNVADINELVAKIQAIQTDMEKLGQTADRLLEDKESREAHLKTLLEQIELLKTIKADKEDLEDALADKADTHTVNRKVSHDQFDAVCDDLTRGLEEAVDKLSKQESIWQQALDELQTEIASKVDKIEMTPLREFVNIRLKSLQEKLKSIGEIRLETEAAGTKKLLRDVQCISCDKDVVMKTEEVAGFRAVSLPCTTSMKPYLTYELDQVRKQQRKLPHSRNMIQFEAAMQEESKKMKTAREETVARTPRDHLCNRYCGGSHTVTTPQQRVMRVGHFLTQWGPEAIQLTDGLIRGKDGQMYRSRLMPCKLDVCGPACWEDQISEDTQSQLSQERAPPVPAAPHKSLQPRRNNAQKRTSRKLSKEPTIIEPPTMPIVEARQIPSPQEEIDDRILVTPTEYQDEIVPYETNEATEEHIE